jgi:threonine dehydrogenase-like Zn-dependent dehydrogenase
VVVSVTISCRECFFCKRGFYSGCERSNPNQKMAERPTSSAARAFIVALLDQFRLLSVA